MRNKGYEGFINAGLIRTKDWEWRMGVNFGHNINEITYANKENFSNSEIVDQMLAGTLAVEGSPIGTLYSYQFASINDEIGYPMFYTKDGRQAIRGEKSQMKLVSCGSIFPKLTGGFDTQLRYKQFSLSMNFTFSLGSVARLPEYYTGNTIYLDPLANLSTDWLRCWAKTGDAANTIYPAPYNSTSFTNYIAAGTPGSIYDTFDSEISGAKPVYPYAMYNYSDIRVAKADFLKLKMIALSYTFPRYLLESLNVNSLKLRFQVTNLFTIADKKWNGLDPETNGANIPALPTYSFGVNVSF